MNSPPLWASKTGTQTGKIRFTGFPGRTWNAHHVRSAIKHFAAPALLAVGLGWGVSAQAQTAPPRPAALGSPAMPTPGPTAAAGAGAIVPGSLSGASNQSTLPAAGSPLPASSAPATATPVPQPSATSPGHFHLHRPGTDVEGDLLTGNSVSDAYVFRGNVTLHSDPKIDKSFNATESDEPITVTADEIDIDRGGMAYVAKGHVHFIQGGRSGHADVGMLNEQTHALDLLGNADVVEGAHRVRAAKMHYDLAGRQFHGVGDVRIYEPAPTPNPNASATPPPKRRRRLPL